MSWRTIIITKHCKLSYKNNYLIIRSDDEQIVHLSEIHTLMIDSCAVSITTYLINELANRKIKLIFCDEQRNPIGEFVPYYNSFNNSKKILFQLNWNDNIKKLIVTEILKQKILNQSRLLSKLNFEQSLKLETYADDIVLFDATNREGHSAKVYFNALFGLDFSRELTSDINSALDYGYSIILSSFNKEIVSKGYLTQLGLKHKNEYNFFNLSCDLMEPFRILIDELVYHNKEDFFDISYKYKLVDILNKKVIYDNKEHFLSNVITLYTKNILDTLCEATEENYLMSLKLYKFI